ncbi:hypothetical protein UlMin_002960 [Ulmus minor]
MRDEHYSARYCLNRTVNFVFFTNLFVCFVMLILLLQHMDEAMYLMRKRIQKFPTLFPQEVVLLDDLWSQLVDAWYKAAVSEKKSFKNWKCPEEGRAWFGAKFLYALFNVMSKHWMAMAIDIKHGHIHLYDCDHACCTTEQSKPFVEPFQFLVPKIIQQCKLFTEEECPNMANTSWPVIHIKEIVPQMYTSRDCGICYLKFIEMHMMKVPFMRLNDLYVEMLRKKLVAEFFARNMDL